LRTERLWSCAIFAAATAIAPSIALAQLEDVGDSSSSGGDRFGVGMEAVLTSPFVPSLGAAILPSGAAAVSYDTGKFRIDGLLYMLFIENAATTFALGARFFYALHENRNADFSIGGGVALGYYDLDPGGDGVRFAIEGAAQLRAFIVENVALSGTLGIGFSLGEGPFVMQLGGQLTGAFGLMYYF
jgi:hypothetical protein